MSSSKNYDKVIHKKSIIGQLESRSKRFFNIEKLANAIFSTNEGIKIRQIRTGIEKDVNKTTDNFIKIETHYLAEKKKFNEKLDSIFLEGLKKEVDILNAFEKNFNG